MEKKILSIDFDIIMYPCINLYNADVDGGDNPIDLWKELEDEYGFENYDILTYDGRVLKEITKLLAENKDKPIYFIQEHQEIVDNLKKGAGWGEDRYDVYNVDFHHDLWYRDTDFAEILKQDEYNCSDWLGYLFLTKKLTGLTWLKAPNSDPPEIKAYGSDLELQTLRIREFYKLHEIDFDEIYFCLSPQWIPQKYKIFYDIIKILIEGK
jgi:hypothetical protein